MTNQTKAADLTTGPLLPKIILFALPLAAASVLQLLFNAADVIVVGRFAGSQALAAVGSTTSLVFLITNLFIGFSVGSNVVAARALGAQDDRHCVNAVHTSLFLALAGGVVLTFVGILTSPTLLVWMGSPEDVIALSTLYLRIYFIGMPAMMFYNFGAALLRAAGDTKRPLYCLAASGCINVGLNLYFVIALNMSVAGVALATIISQVVSAVMVALMLMKEQGPLHLSWRTLRSGMDKPTLVEIVRIGLPAGLQSSLFSLSNVVIQSAVNSFGSIVIAGNSAASSIEGFVYVAMNAFHQACITFTSQNVGARKYENVDRVLLYCQLCAVVSGLVLGIGAYLLGRPLVGIYSSDPAVIEAGVARLSVICTSYFICGIMDVMVGTLRGLGYSVMPMIVSLLGSCALRLVWVWTIFAAVHTIQCLYLSYPITWSVTALAHIACFLYLRRKAFREHPELSDAIAAIKD